MECYFKVIIRILVVSHFTHTTFTLKNNILLIFVDDLRPALGCYGDNQAYTPNIDSLARKSIVFKYAYAQQALCAPSRNSLLTSRRPDTLHLYDFYSYWRDVAGNFTTLPQYFKQHGYHTMSVGKVFHPGMSSNWSDDQPYSWSQYPYHPSTQKYKESAVCSNSDGTLGKNIVCPVEVHFQPGKTLPDLQSLQAAMKFLKERQGSHQPFLLAVGFHKPHVPLKYPREYLKHHPLESVQLPDVRQRPSALPTVAWNPWVDLRERDDIAALNLSFPFQPIPDWYGKLIKQSYYAAVTYIDDLVGQLTNQLLITGHSNDTIILLIGDHGWSMAEHGEWSKFSNFDVAVNVPFLLSIPGQTEGYSRSSHALVELVDIFPTLVELAALPGGVPPLCPDNSSSVSLCTEGISLVSLIQQEIASMHKENQAKVSTHRWKTGVFSQYPRPGVYPTFKPNSDKPRLKDIRIMGYTLRTHRHKYTEWIHFDDNKADWSQVIARELYDHKLDSGEDLNLADRPQFAKLMGRLSQQLRAGWRYSMPKHMYTWENYHSS